MTVNPNQVWTSARGILGVYFLIEGVLRIPSALSPLGYEMGGLARWPFIAAALTQAALALAAGWWLVRGASLAPADSIKAPRPDFLVSALPLMGVYFVVSGLAASVAEVVSMYQFQEAWQTRTGNVAGAAVTLAAGALLIFRPAAVVLRIVSGGRAAELQGED